MLFITFEGIDGCGKSTQAKRLAESLRAEGQTVTLTREPGGTQVGAKIREVLLHGDEEIDPMAEALLFAADRAQHVRTVIGPALDADHIVITDRYLSSSIAYQGARYDQHFAGAVTELNERFALHGCWPDLEFILDLDPAIAAERRAKAGVPADRIEAAPADFHAQVRDNFLAIADDHPDTHTVLSATQGIDAIARRILARTHKALARV